MEENLAEKISRLNRTTTARDMYDLAWIVVDTTRSDLVDRGREPEQEGATARKDMIRAERAHSHLLEKGQNALF